MKTFKFTSQPFKNQRWISYFALWGLKIEILFISFLLLKSHLTTSIGRKRPYHLGRQLNLEIGVPIPNNLSILACLIWEICWETELKVYKHKDEEECKKKNYFPKNEYFIQYKCGFSIQFRPIPISYSLVPVSFDTFPYAKKKERWMDEKVQTKNLSQWIVHPTIVYNRPT